MTRSGQQPAVFPGSHGKAATTITSTSIPGRQKSVVRQARTGGFAGAQCGDRGGQSIIGRVLGKTVSGTDFGDRTGRVVADSSWNPLSTRSVRRATGFALSVRTHGRLDQVKEP